MLSCSAGALRFPQERRWATSLAVVPFAISKGGGAALRIGRFVGAGTRPRNPPSPEGAFGDVGPGGGFEPTVKSPQLLEGASWRLCAAAAGQTVITVRRAASARCVRGIGVGEPHPGGGKDTQRRCVQVMLKLFFSDLAQYGLWVWVLRPLPTMGTAEHQLALTVLGCNLRMEPRCSFCGPDDCYHGLSNNDTVQAFTFQTRTQNK